MMKVEIKNRWDDTVLYSADVEADENTPNSILLRLAVMAALEAKADLRSANLRYANLRYADLRYADLRSFKADLWMTLTQNRREVPALISALRDGRVDGSTYEGECACLVGTIANAKSVNYDVFDHSASNPAEQWFAMIRKGDKPEDDSAGDFASKMALEWSLEWLVLNEMTEPASTLSTPHTPTGE